MTGAADLKRTLPHRYPMLLVDRVTELVPGDRATVLKAVTCNEPWYEDLPTDADEAAHAYPAALLVESWCQAAAVLGASSGPPRDPGDDRRPLLGGLADVVLCGPVRPGDVVEHRVTLVRQAGDALLLRGESAVVGRPVLRVGQATVVLGPVNSARRA